MAQAYSELERKLSNGADDTGSGEDPDPPEDEESTGEGSEGQDETTDPDEQTPAPMSFDKYAQEIAEHGELNEDSYKELEKQGFSKEVVDTYIAGQKATIEARQQKFNKAAGDNLDTLIEWANKNYTPEQQAEYNKLMETNDDTVIVAAIRNLKSDYEAANGVHTPPVQGAVGGVSGDVYTSFEQFTADQRKPEYRTDPAFRQKIIDKLSRSKI